MLSALCFNLDQSKILLSGNGLDNTLSDSLAAVPPLYNKNLQPYEIHWKYNH